MHFVIVFYFPYWCFQNLWHAALVLLWQCSRRFYQSHQSPVLQLQCAHNWLPLIFRMRRQYETTDLTYIIPAHRATVYIMGIALGFVLHYCGRDFKLKKVCVRFGVICVITVNISVSCVVIAYGPQWFGGIFFQLHGRTVSHTVTEQPLQACCFPLVFSQTLLPIICFLYYYSFVSYMFFPFALKG
jgi:hypothetical protein